MRSEANLRLSECQPLPRFGSSPASFWPLCHQMRTRSALTDFDRVPGRGQHRTVLTPKGLPSRLFQDGDRLGSHWRPVLVAGLLVLGAPPYHSGLQGRCPTTGADGWHRCGVRSRARARGRRGTASPHRRDTRRSAWYSSSERTTRVGFFSVGVFRPLNGLASKSKRPCSSLESRGPVQDRDQEASGRMRWFHPTPALPLRPTRPARRARMKRSQSRLRKRLRVCGPCRKTRGTSALRPCRDAACDFQLLVGVTSSP